MVFKNKMLMILFGPNSEEVTGGNYIQNIIRVSKSRGEISRTYSIHGGDEKYIQNFTLRS
jgi:hypothetical protein